MWDCGREKCLRNFKFIGLFLIFCIVNNVVQAQDVLTCGGFVKSEIPIDFSRVEIKLYSKQESMKFQTECAPNNGYYLIPIYDKGDYIIRVEPPEGWHFEPSSVALQIDGVSDPCSLSKDINFQFKGFSLDGQLISRGSLTGPPGVTIELSLAAVPDKILLKSTTDAQGKFRFQNVLPGNYLVTAVSTVNLQFAKKQLRVQVIKDNTVIAEKLVVQGYSLGGRVLGDDEEPVRGVKFVLFGVPSAELRAELMGCDPTLPEAFDVKKSGVQPPLVPICHKESAANGAFVFSHVVPGNYALTPFYRRQNIKFDVAPAKLEVVIGHESRVLPDFKIKGFSVSGRIAATASGRGLVGATVLLDGQRVTETKENGVFQLENMKAGTYKISIIADKIQFTPTNVKISPNTANIPELVASAFEVCGGVYGDEALLKISHQVKFVRLPSRSETLLAATDKSGKYCLWLPPGSHEAGIDVLDNSYDTGIVFLPRWMIVQVADKPWNDINFKLFKGKIHGGVECLQDCDRAVNIILRSPSSKPITFNQLATVILDKKFEFSDIRRGKYELTVSHDAWCWQEKVLKVDVDDRDVHGLLFKQNGFLLTVVSSHSTVLNYELDVQKASSPTTKTDPKAPAKAKEAATKVTGTLNINKGTNNLCLQLPGIYTFTPEGCHTFNHERYHFDTLDPTVITLEATKHLLTGLVISDANIKDLTVTVTTPSDTATLGPLVGLPIKGKFEYAFQYSAAPHTTVDLTPHSEELLFYPVKNQLSLVDDCVADLVIFSGEKGLFINGKVQPPLAGVKVNIKARDGSMKDMLLETDTNGKFRVGPLSRHTEYEVDAEKTGYFLTRGKELGHFTAVKLAEIQVSVVGDDNGKPLPLAGVILSLSGGADYRHNSVTQEDGKFVFAGLGTGQYFLRAMMKEFLFDPPSKMVDLGAGSTVSVVLRGNRVAFSCFGVTTTLTGDPEAGVVIEAVGQGNCSALQEEVTTEPDGTFRIRGLKPYCHYEVRPKKSSEINQHIERSVPKSKSVHIVNGDAGKILLVVFRPVKLMDVTGVVTTSKDHLTNLKVRLTNEFGDAQTRSLAQSHFFQFVSQPLDGRQYTIGLESSLSHVSYDYQLPAEVTFRANETHRHFRLDFQARARSSEHDATQGSYLALPLALLIFFALTNPTRVLPLVAQALQIMQQFIGPLRKNREDLGTTGGTSAPSGSYSTISSTTAASSSSQSSQTGVGSGNDSSTAVKKKAKPRKVQ